MNLYLISQTVNDGWDTYDSAVVAAENEEQARNTHPGTTGYQGYSDWAPPDNVQVQLIGTAVPGTKAGVICSSFNAG